MATVSQRKQCLKCAEALYLVGDLQQMQIYLEALVESGLLTEAEADEIAERATKRCESKTQLELYEIRRHF